MTNISSESQSVRAREIVASAKISNVYRALTGKEPRRAGPGTWRAPAVWRGGDGFNVSMDDARRVWHDFTADEGGGVLDLVARIRGGGRQDALRWLAEFAGVRLDDRPLSEEDRTRWAREQRNLERDLPKAKYWQRAAIVLGEDLLARLKASFFDLTAQDQVSSSELRDFTYLLRRLKQIDGAQLVDEYSQWMSRCPRLTAGMVYAAQVRDKSERRALLAYLTLVASEAPTA